MKASGMAQPGCGVGGELGVKQSGTRLEKHKTVILQKNSKDVLFQLILQFMSHKRSFPEKNGDYWPENWPAGGAYMYGSPVYWQRTCHDCPAGRYTGQCYAKMSTSQRVVMLGGWRVKASIV